MPTVTVEHPEEEKIKVSEHERQMDALKNALDICSKEQDWKAIAIEMAKADPVLFMETWDDLGGDLHKDLHKKVEDAVLLGLSTGGKIEAIKTYRAMTGQSLKEAKEAVENIQRSAEAATKAAMTSATVKAYPIAAEPHDVSF